MKLISCATALLAALVTIQASAADWPQFDFDAQHSGFNSQEWAITSTNVGTLHLAYPAVVLPAIADGAPALLEGVTTPGGIKDLLFLTTKDGRILALDAATGATVWSKQPATGPKYTTSSPTIDPDRQYVYSYGLDGMVHKYQVGDGSEITTGGWPELATRKPIVEKGSSALAIVPTGSANYLVVANGGYPGDAGDYQGHVTVIDLATGSQNVFNANCSDQACHFYENGSGGAPRCSRTARRCRRQSGRALGSSTTPRSTLSSWPPATATSTQTPGATTGATACSRSIPTGQAMEPDGPWTPTPRPSTKRCKTPTPTSGAPLRRFFRPRPAAPSLIWGCRAARTRCCGCSI